MEEKRSTDQKNKKKLKPRLVMDDRKTAWVLSVITVLTILTGFLLTRIESQPTSFLHIILKIVFTIFLVCHTIIVTFLIKYRWKTSIKRILEKKAKTTLKVTQRITGLLVLCSAVLIIISGLDYYFNWGEREFYPSPFRLESLNLISECEGFLDSHITITIGAGSSRAEGLEIGRKKIKHPPSLSPPLPPLL